MGLGGGLAVLGAAALGARLLGKNETVMIESPQPSSTSSGRLPAVFVAHGAPTLALDPQKGADFVRWGSALPRPRAILAVSAHWEAAPVVLGATETRELVYDFSGFPRPLYEVRYPSPGAPDLARRVESLLTAAGQSVRRDEARGLDHGVWVPLVHMFADASVPVLQISMPTSLGAGALFELGRVLAPLRDDGVLVLGSGNLTHNLRRLSWSGAGEPPAWASEFDEWIGGVLARRDFDALVDYANKAPALREAHPTEEHLQPVLVTAGAAASSGGAARFPVQGFEYGSLSRRSVELS